MAAMTAQEFNRYTGRAKVLAKEEPVFVTERGVVQYVLLSINDYESLKLAEPRPLGQNPFEVSEEEYFEIEIPRLSGEARTVDFS